MIKKRIYYLIPLIIIIIGLVLNSACASLPSGQESSPASMSAPAPGPAPGEYITGDKGYSDEGIDNTLSDGDTERLIVRNGSLTLEVDEVEEAMDKIADIAAVIGGYVVSSYKYEVEEGTSGEISIRVPSDRFDEAFDRLHQIAQSVPYEHTDSRDVTEEYVDLQARLKNLEATELQYLELLKKAETVDEMLQVQRELSNVREWIEQLQGRIKYLERVSEMALIDVSLNESGSLAGPWSLVNTIKSAAQGVIAFARGLLTLIIWFGVFSWIWIPILIIWRRRRKKSRNAIS
jgi:hypothetical protein